MTILSLARFLNKESQKSPTIFSPGADLIANERHQFIIENENRILDSIETEELEQENEEDW